MNKTNVIIGTALALGLLAAVIIWLYGLGTDALLGAVVVPGIVDGVSSPQWWDAQKAEPF